MSGVQKTPLMEQYDSIKSEHTGEVLFFRLGDFYEMFDSDAVEISRLLNLTLTHRGDSPMCGIPYHSAKIYIARLLRMGKKIAICEQVGQIAAPGGLTERKVVEIITPGTAVEAEYLDRSSNSYLASFSITKGHCGFAYIDVTTSQFYATSFPVSSLKDSFPKELSRCSPKEILLPLSLKDNEVIQMCIQEIPGISVSFYPDWQFNAKTSYERLLSQFKTANLSAFSLSEQSPEVIPAGFLLEYLDKTTNCSLPHVKGIKLYSDDQYLIIDDSSMRNLEVVQNIRDQGTEYTLLDCVNYTLTAMGNRMLRSWLSSPLTDLKTIVSRQDHIQLFYDREALQTKIREYLAPVLDIERLAGRIAMDRAHAKDLLALAQSLQCFIKIEELLSDYDMGALDTQNAVEMVDLIQNAICDDPATSLTEGRLIREGWSEKLDHYKMIQNNFSSILADYEEEERGNTGINNLKIKHSGPAGYFIEVTKGKLSQVPSHFIIRRAMVNSDRYTTERLQELEKELNDAESNIIETERDLFLEVRSRLQDYVPYLMEASSAVAYSDVTSALSYAAVVNHWVRPQLDEGLGFCVKGGRHPVVEKHLPSSEFVPNDFYCQGREEGSSDENVSFALITGPNMAGKSTYLRQNALIALLAQTGSFVPAKEASLGIVDRIFCRVGASDNLARGESTFLVEMTETARILRSATCHSLVIMDEVGRGTSTEDGLSIAWAVSEYLLNEIRCRTLFATHYHELTRLSHPNVCFLCMDVREDSGSVVFLRKIKEGSSENSYGIHVARLAGVPESVINRANEIICHIQSLAGEHPVLSMDSHSIEGIESVKTPAAETVPVPSAPGLFSDEEIVLDGILSADPDSMTPIEALQTIARWKKQLSGR